MEIKGLMISLGMDVFAIVSLVVFFSAFLGIVVWTWRRPRKEMEARSRLCLDDEET